MDKIETYSPMEKCLIIINKNAGNCRKCSEAKVASALNMPFEYDTVFLPSDSEINFSGYRNVAVCGGDGTLSTVMQQVYDTNRTIYYFPCGTLNDKAKAKRHGGKTEKPKPAVIGKVDDGIFTYVYAAGAFTPIGYIAPVKAKQRLGILAYVFKILDGYKVNRIKAEITVNENAENNSVEHFSGEYNLIMLIKSPRCFGFPFNHAYDENKNSGHLVLIHSPKHGGLLGKIEMFFPFFRVFFMGLKDKLDGKVVFREVNDATIELPSKTSFCVDGEQTFKEGELHICFEKTKCRLHIVHGIK